MFGLPVSALTVTRIVAWCWASAHGVLLTYISIYTYDCRSVGSRDAVVCICVALAMVVLSVIIVAIYAGINSWMYLPEYFYGDIWNTIPSTLKTIAQALLGILILDG